MFEKRTTPLLPRARFLLRMARYFATALGVVLGGLGLGAVGYRHFERLSWLDAVYNAAMILSGMGPATDVRSTGGKLFATCYALLSGFVFLTVASLLFGPLLHRMIHRFHLETEADVAEDAAEPPATPPDA